jgi:FKBP-type peptidyl-prolyl cis-trans isomerase FkpA
MIFRSHRTTALLAVLALTVSLSACQRADDTPPPEEDVATPAVTELQIETLAEGEGEAIQPGQRAVVHYTGWLYDPARDDNKGSQFDSSHPRGAPFDFTVGAGQVIRGWDEGVAGMRVGEVRQLLIPPDMAYGQRGAGGVIPANATLLFEVELLEIR